MSSESNTQITKINDQFFNTIQQKFCEVSNLREFKTESSFAVQIVHGNSYIKKIALNNPTSLLKAVMNIAQIGLTLNPILQLAYLVPMGGEVVLMPSYKGLVKLLTDTGSVETAYSHLVYEGDVFEISMGTECNVVHNAAHKSKTVVGCYAIGVLKSGLKQVEFMDLAELHQIRALSEQYKGYLKRNKSGSCIWVDHEGQMMRKTVVKRLCNQLPRTDLRVAKAIDLDNYEYKVTENQRYFIDQLIESTNLPVEFEDRILAELPTATSERAGQIIEEIKSYQPKSLNEQFKEIVLANPSTPIK